MPLRLGCRALAVLVGLNYGMCQNPAASSTGTATATIDALRAKGYEIRPIARSGAVNGIIIDPSTGLRLGGADPREDGYALGW